MERSSSASICSLLPACPLAARETVACLLIAVCIAVATPHHAFATLFVNFGSTSTGGIQMDLQFKGAAEPDPIQPRWIELILPGGTILGGGSARSDFHFNDTLVSNVSVNGQEMTPSYVRLGNHIASEQFFIFIDPGISTGQEVDMHIFATWQANNLPYSALKPGTYTAVRPRFGNAIITIAPVPEPSTVMMVVVAVAVFGASRSRAFRDRTIRDR